MNAAYLRRLLDYNYWAHRRVWECALALIDEQFDRPTDFSVGSVHAQLVHTMGAEWLMLSRAKGVPIPRIPPVEQYPTRESIRARWDELEAEWRAFLDSLSDDDLSRTVVYTSFAGNKQRTSLIFDLVMQAINHSTDHRAQTLALIHQLGGKTVEQDWIFYSWENS